MFQICLSMLHSAFVSSAFCNSPMNARFLRASGETASVCRSMPSGVVASSEETSAGQSIIVRTFFVTTTIATAPARNATRSRERKKLLFAAIVGMALRLVAPAILFTQYSWKHKRWTKCTCRRQSRKRREASHGVRCDVDHPDAAATSRPCQVITAQDDGWPVFQAIRYLATCHARPSVFTSNYKHVLHMMG